MKFILTLATAASVWVGTALAQNDEIVVTGTRIARFENEEVPTVTIRVRPDFVTDTLTIWNDARDEPERNADLLRTLDRVIAAANRRKDIEVSAFKRFEDDETYSETTFVVPVPAVEDERGDLVETAGGVDTAMIELLVKTPVDDRLTFEAAEKRLSDFADGINGLGRTKVYNDEEYAVSVRDLQRHRIPLMEAVAEEVTRVRAVFPRRIGRGQRVGEPGPLRADRSSGPDLVLSIQLDHRN